MSPVMRPCSGGCGALVPRGRCSTCGLVHERTRRPGWVSTFYGSVRWQKTRRMKLNVNPMCERCDPITSASVAVEVHHLIPLLVRPDLGLSLENLESLCTDCHHRIDRMTPRW